MPDYFSRTEAEALLPRVTPVLQEIARLRRDQVDHDEAVAADRAKILGNGHMPAADLMKHQALSAAAQQRIVRLLRAINALGILVKDLDTGLIDFPTLRDGREVYLCWQLGEPHIAWWHETTSGYSGRQPLEDEEG
jgi:hypothetical protein